MKFQGVRPGFHEIIQAYQTEGPCSSLQPASARSTAQQRAQAVPSARAAGAVVGGRQWPRTHSPAMHALEQQKNRETVVLSVLDCVMRACIEARTYINKSDPPTIL